ncbi:tyrosine-type recombinase/integrase [Tautonia sociabilis]|uniref:Integrase n=1 Tax=Tautonia sociabilis TaxID=2080755 RepID=A0A432MF77_9BACT|nr:tyrosine-type recombinase/integrase [Tautonia sociabilis]RUL84576.1 integrase [Tautonia sociabilis]
MTDERTPATIEPAAAAIVPAVVARFGENAAERFFTFFTDNIRNPNTRAAYYRNAQRFFAYCGDRGLELRDIKSYHVSAYVEELAQTMAAPSVKQHLAAIRMLYDWLIVGQVVEINPAQAVRGPRHVVKKGKTPVLTEDEARDLLKSIDGTDPVSLRDRALIAVCLYSFARIEAALGMDVADYYPQGKRWWFRLKEKGGKHHDMPAHHKAEEFVDAYIQAAGLKDQKKTPLFRTAIGKTRTLGDRRMSRHAALKMVQRRARKAGIATAICCHSFRATGITNYLEHDGTLEKAQQMAAHESPKTTKLYDRTADQITLDEVERISI